jgi:hypothetical protein
MNLLDIFNENRLATASVALGILAIVVFFLLYGTVDVFLYLGIPAIIFGVVSLMRLKKRRDYRYRASIALPVAGIILGLLPILFTFLSIY